jgi:hypothetical protein
MELHLKRTTKGERYTIGDLYINGAFECFILEDVDRGLNQHMTIQELASRKIKAQTAIPTGKYEIAITFSNRFKKYLPLLISVPGFDGIRIHPGNTHEDTEGCLLPGEFRDRDRVINSRKTFNKLFQKLKTVEKKEKILITVE